MMMYTWYVATKRGWAVRQSISLSEAGKIVVDAIPSLMLIVIIIGGIVGGIVTAVEASGIAVIYTMLLAFVVHRTVPISKFWSFLVETAEMTGAIMLLLAASAALSFAMAFTGIPAAVTSLILGISSDPIVVLLIVNLLLLVVGCFMDIGPAILIFTPILLPIVTKVGMDPVHFGVVLVFNLAIGTITPPVGSGLYVGASVAKVKVENAVKALLPFYVIIFAVLMLITYVPSLTMTLPRLAGM
jgi:tripartite ATP-independent transporter DctM subunit